MAFKARNGAVLLLISAFPRLNSREIHRKCADEEAHVSVADLKYYWSTV